MDALDEILDESKRLLLLETLVHGKVNIMVTSRPIDSIRDLFGPITDISCDGCEEENLRLIYHCKQCMGRGFDLCEACRGQELTCPNESHYIVKRFGAYQIDIEATEGDVRSESCYLAINLTLALVEAEIVLRLVRHLFHRMF